MFISFISFLTIHLQIYAQYVTLEYVSEDEDLSQKGQFNMNTPIKPLIDFADLTKLDVRVGTIQSVENVKTSNKLVKMKVDFGDFDRQILVGMQGEREDTQEVVGLQALFIVNMTPKKMAGEISEGMLFDIGFEDGIVPVLATPEKPVPNGTRVG